MGDFLYPRTIKIQRQMTNSGAAPGSVGMVGYSGRENAPAPNPAGLETILEDIPASIQSRGVGRVMRDMLPSGITSHPQWRILTKASAIPDRYAVRDNDIVTDDQGYRYQVAQNYWTPMGFRLDCVRLEA
jgi:hypothetical protein